MYTKLAISSSTSSLLARSLAVFSIILVTCFQVFAQSREPVPLTTPNVTSPEELFLVVRGQELLRKNLNSNYIRVFSSIENLRVQRQMLARDTQYLQQKSEKLNGTNKPADFMEPSARRESIAQTIVALRSGTETLEAIVGNKSDEQLELEAAKGPFPPKAKAIRLILEQGKAILFKAGNDQSEVVSSDKGI